MESSTHVFCASFSVCSTVVDRFFFFFFYLVHIVIIIPLSLPRHSCIFCFFSMCILMLCLARGWPKLSK